MEQTKKVQIRGGFSDRTQTQVLNTTIQLKHLDQRTKNKLLNMINDFYMPLSKLGYKKYIFRHIIDDAFGDYISPEIEFDIDHNSNDMFKKYIYDPIMNNSYDEALSLVEYIIALFNNIAEIYVQNQPTSINYFPNYAEEINRLFTDEFVGYRIIDGLITPITDEIEIKTITEGLDIKFEGCKSHLRKSLKLISDRDFPDYNNSIKESISAVESICKIIANDDNATLKIALNKIESNGTKLHIALKEAFLKLYGYTSDEDGIRHANGMTDNNARFEEAKFMLVSCCAFVNYLISLYGSIRCN